MSIIDKTISTEATRRNVKLMLPVLVYWAKTGQKEHTYGDLISAIGKERFSGIGHALYAVQSVLNALAEQEDCDIPTLNSLCKNAKTNLPSEGFEFIEPKYNELGEGKRIFVEGLDSKAINYTRWNWVLCMLELDEYKPFSDEELESKKNPHLDVGGEGREQTSTEHVLPSGDRLDVYLELSDGTHVCIEVKPSISPEQEINRGIFQCVKYYAIMEAQRTIEGADYAIEVLLVTTGKFSKLNITLANELCIDYTDAIKINS